MAENSHFDLADAEGKNLRDALEEFGAPLPKACGSGRCGMCKARVLSGEIEEDGRRVAVGAYAKSCRSVVRSKNARVEIAPARNIENVELSFALPAAPKCGAKTGFGAALDIGTTTVALLLFDLQSGKILASEAMTNPQIKWGEDVISRIARADTPANLAAMRSALLDALDSRIATACARIGISKIDAMHVAGNTVMMHIFFGEDPGGLGRAPWTPKFLEGKSAPGSEFFKSAKVGKIVGLPCVAPFVGADLSAAAALTGLLDADKNVLIADVGTNAEILLKADGRLFCASAAAGPALEGWGLSCAMRASRGAVSSFAIENAQLTFETVANEDAAGICGSGYIDFLAAARRLGLINSSGRFEAQSEKIRERDGAKFYEVCAGVEVSESDIATLMKAKAAVGAAIETMFKKLSLTRKDMDEVFIAGGFGRNMNLQSAAQIGMLPPFEAQKVSRIGNSSLGGAYLCALDDGALASLAGISEKFESVRLNLEPDFEDDFIDALFLP